MPARKLTLWIILLCVINTTYAQRYRPTLISDLVTSSDSIFSVKGKFDGTFDEVVTANEDIGKRNMRMIDKRIVVKSAVQLTLQKGDDIRAYLNFEGLHFENAVVIELEETAIFLHFINCHFERKLTIRGKNSHSVTFENSIFNGPVRCELAGDESFLTLYENQFYPDKAETDTINFYGFSTTSPLYENSVMDTLAILGNPILHPSRDIHITHKGNYFSFSKNKIFTTRNRTVALELDESTAHIQENLIEGPLQATGNITADLLFKKNELKSLVSIEAFNFPTGSKLELVGNYPEPCCYSGHGSVRGESADEVCGNVL